MRCKKSVREQGELLGGRILVEGGEGQTRGVDEFVDGARDGAPGLVLAARDLRADDVLDLDEERDLGRGSWRTRRRGRGRSGKAAWAGGRPGRMVVLGRDGKSRKTLFRDWRGEAELFSSGGETAEVAYPETLSTEPVQ